MVCRRPSHHLLERSSRGRGLMGAVDSVVETAAGAWDDTRAYLATPRGRELRRQVAAAVILLAPLASKIPVFRRTLVGRALRVAAVGTLMVKGAEWIRDWEPQVTPLREEESSRPARRRDGPRR